MLQAVAGLAPSHPPPPTHTCALATSAKPSAAYPPPNPILRPLTAAAVQPTSLSPDPTLVSRLAPLPRPKTSPAGGGAHLPPDTSDILRIEHLPEWQASVAAWSSQAAEKQPQKTGCSTDRATTKPGEKMPAQAKWRAAGSRVNHMIASGNVAAFSAPGSTTTKERDTPALVRCFMQCLAPWMLLPPAILHPLQLDHVAVHKTGVLTAPTYL